jgi:hypothetical protein
MILVYDHGACQLRYIGKIDLYEFGPDYYTVIPTKIWLDFDELGVVTVHVDQRDACDSSVPFAMLGNEIITV